MLASRLRKLLYGCLPESELAIAAIQAKLDLWPQGDAFARFLDRWRNAGPEGDESFYEALDRTAGSEDALFFFDAMLNEFVREFAPKDGKRWSLQERHDHLHASFLTYRQYRGFLEAVSYCAVLPSTISLPIRLQRYDYSQVPGEYNLRDDLDVLAGKKVGDYDAVIEECHELIQAHPLPERLWQGYDLYEAFQKSFVARLPQLAGASARGTDELLAQQRRRTANYAEALRDAAWAALEVE